MWLCRMWLCRGGHRHRLNLPARRRPKEKLHGRPRGWGRRWLRGRRRGQPLLCTLRCRLCCARSSEMRPRWGMVPPRWPTLPPPTPPPRVFTPQPPPLPPLAPLRRLPLPPETQSSGLLGEDRVDKGHGDGGDRPRCTPAAAAISTALRASGCLVSCCGDTGGARFMPCSEPTSTLQGGELLPLVWVHRGRGEQQRRREGLGEWLWLKGAGQRGLRSWQRQG